MSSIGSLGNHSDVGALLQQAIQQRLQGNAGSAASSTSANDARVSEAQSRFGKALELLGVSPDEASTIQDEIKSAISSVRDGDKDDGGRPDLDDIKSAVGQVLKNHGIDAARLRELLLPKGGQTGTVPFGTDSGTYSSNGTLANPDVASQLLSAIGTKGGQNDATLGYLQDLQLRLDATA